MLLNASHLHHRVSNDLKGRMVLYSSFRQSLAWRLVHSEKTKFMSSGTTSNIILFGHLQKYFHMLSVPSTLYHPLAAILRCCYCYTQEDEGEAGVNLWEHEQRKLVRFYKWSTEWWQASGSYCDIWWVENIHHHF